MFGEMPERRRHLLANSSAQKFLNFSPAGQSACDQMVLLLLQEFSIFCATDTTDGRRMALMVASFCHRVYFTMHAPYRQFGDQLFVDHQTAIFALPFDRLRKAKPVFASATSITALRDRFTGWIYNLRHRISAPVAAFVHYKGAARI